MRKPQLCFELPNGAFPIKLLQVRADNFTVAYGKQIDANLSYGDAARKLGEAIMHSLACEGKLDNG